MELSQTHKGKLTVAVLLLIIALTSLLLTGVTKAADSGDARVLFRMTGSNTFGADLAPALVKQYLHSLGATDIRQRGQGEKHWIDAHLQHERVVVPIVALGSSTGFKALNGDSADIAMASRRVKAKEVEMLARLGDFTSAQAEHVIGLDALVITVHKDNPIKRLSLAQLAQIYTGEIRNWAQLGGDDQPIRPLHRDIESGTRSTFDSEVFGGSRPAKPFVYEVSGNQEMRDLVVRNPAAIGYLPFADATGLPKVAIKSGELAAVVPNRGIIATEDFPLTRRLYLYRNPGRFNPQVDAFLHFAESHAGQRIVEDIGFINLTPVALQMAPFANAPENYRTLMENGSRLSISFRFANGSTELDNRALRDLHRLRDYMSEEENRDLSLTLVGFSDRKSSETISDLISRFRALKVQGALLRDHQMGDSQIMSVGAFAPLTADSEQGPVKNSRVEVWIN
ncbi:substrate-binding domain-containing protein [Microbulbifer agarilyticus]|uniref:substrate-binding domain-containing protein n=1 Tax=Microbulbifer agarilyticus TaxID=260552 RepID=UPI001CD461BE|nr:substrate-binding domain-containing protein [Microbulbifer agarilyticus]MCA0899277.1 phosphate ABC transporter substrate-binding protein [Microbulbifer agarilyticus]